METTMDILEQHPELQEQIESVFRDDDFWDREAERDLALRERIVEGYTRGE